MLRLIFTVCMIDAPDTCEQREMLVYEHMPVMACMAGAMPELATWRETHPNWRIVRWHCNDDRTAHGGMPQAAPLDETAPGMVPAAVSR